jgi:hypothetical protein
MKIGDVLDIKVEKTKHIYKNGIPSFTKEKITISAKVVSEGIRNFILRGKDGIRYSIEKEIHDRMPR